MDGSKPNIYRRWCVVHAAAAAGAGAAASALIATGREMIHRAAAAVFAALVVSSFLVAPVASCRYEGECTGVPPKPENGYYIECTDMPQASTCEGFCNPGFKLKPDVNKTGVVGLANACVDGEYKGWYPGCEAIACSGNPEPVIVSGFVGLFTTCSNTPLNQTCYGGCVRGLGTVQARCELDPLTGGAVWRYQGGECLPLPLNPVNPPADPTFCPGLPTIKPASGSPWPGSCADRPIGFMCETNCTGFDGTPGFSTGFGRCCFGAPPRSRCQENGTWSSVITDCERQNGRRLTASTDDAADSGISGAAIPDPDPRALLLQTTGALALNVKPVVVLPGGEQLVVAPLTITDTDWAGHTAEDMAACLSAALATVGDVHLLTEPPSERQLQQQVARHMQAGKLSAEHARRRVDAIAAEHAAALSADDPTASELLRLLGNGSLFLSPMAGNSMSLKVSTLKAQLVQHYDALVKLPRCLVAPFGLRMMLKNARSQPGSSGVVVTARAKSVMQEHHPERCANIEGARFTARFLTSMASVSKAQSNEPNSSLWLFVGSSADGDSCSTLLSASAA